LQGKKKRNKLGEIDMVSGKERRKIASGLPGEGRRWGALILGGGRQKIAKTIQMLIRGPDIETEVGSTVTKSQEGWKGKTRKSIFGPREKKGGS